MRPRARDLLARGGMLVIGHRGASAHAPENTLPAFALALEAGADLVELDVRETRDGVPVVLHDPTLDRTTDAVDRWGGAELAVADRTAEDLRALDAGAWFGPAFAGTRLPGLDQALAAIQPRGVTLIERKTGAPGPILERVAAAGAADRVVVQAFDWDFVAACRAAHPTLVLGALGSKALPPERLDRLAATGADVVVWRYADVDADLVARVRARGLALWVYTVDDPEGARALARLGVGGIITNEPAGIRRALAE